MANTNVIAAIEIVQRLRRDLAYAILSGIDKKIPLAEVLETVNNHDGIKAADKFIEESIWGKS